MPLQSLGVKSLDLFGSVLRDEANPDSDVDFIVEFWIEATLLDLLRVQHYLEDILEYKVDFGDNVWKIFWPNRLLGTSQS